MSRLSFFENDGPRNHRAEINTTNATKCSIATVAGALASALTLLAVPSLSTKSASSSSSLSLSSPQPRSLPSSSLSLIPTIRWAAAASYEDNTNGEGDGADSENKRGNKDSNAATRKQQWNGNHIEWVNFKTARSVAEKRLALELEAAGEDNEGKGRRGKVQAKSKKSRKVNNSKKSGSSAGAVTFSSFDDSNKKAAIFYLFHKTQCPACKTLERAFTSSMSIEVLSRYFLMVSVKDDEDPAEPQYEPQGAYYPRILFAAANGTVLPQIKNDTPLEADHEHYFANEESIVKAMKKTLQLVGGFTTFRGL